VRVTGGKEKTQWEGEKTMEERGKCYGRENENVCYKSYNLSHNMREREREREKEKEEECVWKELFKKYI